MRRSRRAQKCWNRSTPAGTQRRQPRPPSQRGLNVTTRTIYGIRRHLLDLGLPHNKHVPAIYLRASVAQRQAVAQGLMDTDGSWNKRRNRAVFTTTSKALAAGMMELLVSLGQRPQEDWRTVHGFGLTVWRCAIEFTPIGFVPFRLARKANQVVVGPRQIARANRRTITSVTPGPDVPTACIGVDSPNATYLCSESMIPTHNTKNGLAGIRGGFADESHRFQRHLQGYAAIQNGLVPDTGLIVRNVFVDRSGKDPDPHVEQEPWSMAVVREATEFLSDALYAVEHNETAQQDKPRYFCKVACEHFADCRGREVEVSLIADPDTRQRVEAFHAAKKRRDDAIELMTALRNEGLEGLSGQTDSVRIVSTFVNATNRTPHWKVETEDIAS